MFIIIGASSFIGVYTVEEFRKHGCEIMVTGYCDQFHEYYDKLKIPFVNLDLTNPDDFNKLPTTGVDGVILLAGLLPANAHVDLNVDENAADYIKINTLGTINVLEYCRKNKIKRVISTSSYADVRHSWTDKKAITEEEPRGYDLFGDHCAYVISKNAACDMLGYYNEQHGMANCWFRFPPVYGVGPHGSLYVNGVLKKSGLQIFMEKASSGEDITVFGNKNLGRDVVYVKDVARAFYLAINSKNAKGLYNMTSGRCVTLQEQAEVIRDIFSQNPNKKSKIIYDETVANNTPSFLFSMEKAKRDFGFVPEYSDFRKMMIDYKKDLDANKFWELFHYEK